MEEFQDKIGRDSGALRCTHGKVSCLGFPVMGDLRSQVFSLSGFSPGRGSQGPRFHRNARRNPERRPMTGKWVTTLVPEPAAGSLPHGSPGARAGDPRGTPRVAYRPGDPPPGPSWPPTRCQPITPLDSPLVLFFVAVSHGVIGEDSLMESSDI